MSKTQHNRSFAWLVALCMIAITFIAGCIGCSRAYGQSNVVKIDSPYTVTEYGIIINGLTHYSDTMPTMKPYIIETKGIVSYYTSNKLVVEPAVMTTLHYMEYATEVCDTVKIKTANREINLRKHYTFIPDNQIQ